MTGVFRDLVQQWDDDGTLLRVHREVSPKFELGALSKQFKGRQPLLFERVSGYTVPVVTGIGGDRALIARTLGIAPTAILSHLMAAIVNPVPTRTVSAAPVQEQVVLRPRNLGALFPVMTYHELDSGPYFVSGVLVVKDPQTGARYTSVRRMQLLAGGRTNVAITSQELFAQFLQFESADRPLEVAVMFGVVPAVVLGSQISTHLYHVDKLNVAGGLLGEALEVVPCKTVDLEVLAQAEIVFEGRMLPGVREPEQPFAELGGYYGPPGQQPVIEVTAVTHRNQPIMQTIMPASWEEKLPMALAREMVLYQTVRQVVPNLLAVHLTMGGIGRFHAVLCIDKQQEGDGKQAALAAFASDKDLKHVVVVDTDVDIFDADDVEWAIATRVQADIDVFIVPGARGSPLEASHNLRGASAKMGIDATVPLHAAAQFLRSRVPGEKEMNIHDYVDWGASNESHRYGGNMRSGAGDRGD